MPPAETALERIRLAPDTWAAAHVLLAVAAGAWVLTGLVVLRATIPSIAAFVVLCAGVVLAAMTNGIDAVLGVLAGVNADGEIHRAIAENLVQPLDIWDFALTLGLVALVALLHTRSTVPWWGTTAALVGLAVPAFNDLRVAAAIAVLLGFAVLGASLLRAPRPNPTLASIVIALAYLPAAFFSLERAVLLGVVALIVGAAWLARRQSQNRKVTAL